jgi:hypothetical protein
VFAKSGKSLIDGVVYNLIDEMVQTTDIGTADIHGRALAHRGEPLENDNVRRIVIVGHLYMISLGKKHLKGRSFYRIVDLFFKIARSKRAHSEKYLFFTIISVKSILIG